jgi:hypothetical protein
VLVTFLIAGVCIACVVAAVTWGVRRAMADDDGLGTISTQWVSNHRVHEREHSDR